MNKSNITHRTRLSCDPVNFTYSIENGGRTWRITKRPFVRFADGTTAEFPEPFETGRITNGTADGYFSVCKNVGGRGLNLRASVTVEHETGDVYFTLAAEDGTDTGDAKIDRVAYPSPVDFGTDFGDTAADGEGNLPECYTVIPRMQGTLIPAGSSYRFDGPVFEREAYMPFFGQVRRGGAYIMIYDTPYDARIVTDGDSIRPEFVPSLGKMRYPRRMLMRFMEGDYNEIAQSYRAYVKERGRLVTLHEKAIRNPRVFELIGCPVIHSGIATHISPDSDYYHRDDPSKNDSYTSFGERAEQMRELHRRGLRKAYTHFDGWGRHGYDNLHPDPLPPHEKAGGTEGMRELADTVNGLGYIFGIHDQYRDYYYDAPSFSFDNAVMYEDGSHPFCSIWYGGKHSFLCSAVAPGYVRRNYAKFRESGIDVRAAYLDVFSVVKLDECFNPEHPATREDCAKNRRECLDILTDQGIIPSSEEVLDCILPSQVLCHHAPFFTSSLGSSHAESVGIPVPLLNLVYHDCVVIPWIGRKKSRGGWGIPSDVSGYAYARLCGNPVYLSITADEEEIAEAAEVCEAAENLAFEPIVRHRFISADRRIQSCEFASGVVTEVNFDEC